MNHKLKSRNQKIKFLNGLRSGENHVSEILPPSKYEVWFWVQKKGAYEHGLTEISVISEADYKAKLAKEFKEVVRLETLPEGDEMCLIERTQADSACKDIKPFSHDQVVEIVKGLRGTRNSLSIK